ncbi:MAG TPA: glycosyltransferase [Streptosporangiaceae bacterium]
MSTTNTQGQHVVTAVIVAHDGAAWLPRIAEALLGQTRPVQRVVAVDTGSRDRSGAVLAELLGRSVVFGMDRRTGYGAAIAHALRHRAANTNVPGPAGLAPGERTEWVWLLHDDSEPAPDALEQLLRGAAEARSSAVLGPKVMDWADRRVLLEAGITIDSAGRRITGIEPREVDQGQHDGDRDVMAVSSAGMLVRRDVWDQAGGFDPAMPLLRDDVDFCWRVHAAGHRVRVVTDAVVYHLEATARNRRTPSAAPRPRRMDRHNALLTLLANLPLAPALSALAGNLVLSALRTVFFLLAKRPRAALDEFTGVTSVLGHPLQLAAARRRRSRGRRAAYSRLRGDLPPGHSVRRLAEFAASVFYTSTQIDTAGSHHATDDPSDDDYMLVDNGFAQRILTHPGVLLVAGLTVVALIAERSLLGAGTLTGGALTPAWGGASGLWQEYLQGFHPAGIGSASSTPPYVAVIAALATVLGGKPWLAIDVIMIGCIPLAGLSAFLAARRVTTSVLARVWAAAAYALLPVGMGAVAAGRFGSAVVFALIPVIALLAARIFAEAPRRARRAAWAAGLVIAIAAAFVPLVWVVAVLAALAAAVAFRQSGRGMLLNLGITVVVPPILLLPWTLQVATQPSLLFLEAGNKVPGLATAALPARSLLLLSPGGPGLPPFWVTGGLALAALAALLLTARRFLVMAGWLVALLGLLVSVAVSRMLLTPDDASGRVTGWPGISLAIAAAGLVLAAVVAADALPGQLSEGRWRRPAGFGVLILAAAACSAPLLAAGSWVATGVRGPVGGTAGPVLPPFVSVSSANGMRPRTLVLRAGHGTITYEVLRGTDPLLGATDLAQPTAAQRTLDSVVSTLAAQGGGDAQDQGQALAALDIGYVLLPAPGNAVLASTLNNVADLRPVSKTAGFQLWRVAQTTARVRVAGPGGKLVAVPSGPVSVPGAAAPRGGGTLELAEPSGGWTASLNGTALQSVPSPAGSWAQAFRLPPGGGTLVISHGQLGRTLIVAVEALALLVVAGLGLPGARLPGESRGAAAEHAPGGRRERREQAADGPGEPDLPGSTPPGEDGEPSRGSRLARRAAVAGRPGPGRAGRQRAAADLTAADLTSDLTAPEGATAGRTAGGPGRRAAAAGRGGPGLSGPGLSGPGPGAPPSGPGAGRRGTLGTSRRSPRADNEDLSAGAGTGPDMGAGAEAATAFGAGPAGAAGDPPPARPGSPAGPGFWEQDDSPTMLGERSVPPWEDEDDPTGALAALASSGVALAGAGSASDQDDAPAADRGGRKLWRRGKKARKDAEREGPEQEAAAAYPRYAGSGDRGPEGTGPRRRAGGASGPQPGRPSTSGDYPGGSYASGEYATGDYAGAGRRRGHRGAGLSVDGSGPGDGGADYAGTDEGGMGYAGAGYGGGGFPGAGDPRAGDPRAGGPGAGDRSRGPGYGGAGYGGAGAGTGDRGSGRRDAEDNRAGYPGAGYPGAGHPSGGYARGGYPSGGYPSGDYGRPSGGDGRADRGRAGYGGDSYGGDSSGTGPYGRGSYGSGEYPQQGQGGGRRVSRGRLPGDDDVLPPPRRGTGSGGYPAGADFPDPAYPDGPEYPGPGTRDYPGSTGPRAYPPGSTGPRAYPGDSSQSGAGGQPGPAWSSPEPSGSVWEPSPDHGSSTPGAGYAGTGYPGPADESPQYQPPGRSAAGHSAAARPAAGRPGGDYPGGSFAETGDPDPEPYSGTEFAGPDYPAAEDYSSSRAHVAWGHEPADEPGEGDW